MTKKYFGLFSGVLIAITFYGIASLHGCAAKRVDTVVNTDVKVAPYDSATQEVKTDKPAITTTEYETHQISPERIKEIEKTTERALSRPSWWEAIHFGYDRAIVRLEDTKILVGLAEELRSFPGARLRIEGNCDERGTHEYNLALGQRRGTAAAKYLRDLGVTNSMDIVCYGKERLACILLPGASSASAEACHQVNRRVDFTITY